jgi:unsaturated rhamnogalacturonyl hydrolase
VNRFIQPKSSRQWPGTRWISFSHGMHLLLFLRIRGYAWVALAAALGWLGVHGAPAQTPPASVRIAHVLLQSRSGSHATWNEETGTQLEGLDAEWYNTANGDYFHYVKRTVDSYLDARPPAAAEVPPNTPMADALLGRQLLRLYRVTLAARYYDAATELRSQVAAFCGIQSTAPGPSDAVPAGLAKFCVAEPFVAEYASVFHVPQDFEAITKDFLQWEDAIHQHPAGTTDLGPDARSNDEARLAAALVDSLPYYSPDDPGRMQLMAVLDRIASGITKQQNGATAAMPVDRHAVSLYIYALLKGVRCGYLPARYSTVAERAWENLQKDSDDASDRGALLLAATEIDLAPTATRTLGQNITVDAWFNSQQRKNAAGQMEYFHYKWSDFSDSGYSLLGHMFQSYGVFTDTLYSAPTKENLRKTQFYLIVSPDIPVKNPTPHYMTDRDAEEIASWVHDGGVLILMENDPPNADIAHLNLLADRFGIHFNDVLSHHILGEQVENGTIAVHPDGRLFHEAHTLYMKDTCSISLRRTASALLSDRGDVVMATVKYGRGTVFAAVDPWVYNEYTDGRKDARIYGQFDNFAGGRELVRWLLDQRPLAHSGRK